MKTVMKFLAFAVAAAAALLFFAPKENLYYLLEQRMEPYGVVVSDEKLYERAAGLHLDGAELYVKEVPSASVEKAEILCLGLYNRIDAEGVRLAPAFEQFIPRGIERMRLSYALFDPLHLRAEAVGEFGSAEARISLRERLARVHLVPSEQMSTQYGHTLGRLSQDETGGYVYEYRF